MANQLHGYNSVYGAAPATATATAAPTLSTTYSSSRSLSDIVSGRYLLPDSLSSSLSIKHSVTDRASMFSTQKEALMLSAADIVPRTSHLVSSFSWPGSDVAVALDSVVSGIKRSSDENITDGILICYNSFYCFRHQMAFEIVGLCFGFSASIRGVRCLFRILLYDQTVLGSYNTLGQSEAWYSSNSLAKRPRFESTSNLPVYPQRPGEKDCAHYMLTRTCKFGDSCKFDHPIWVPEGGIPDWKEVPQIANGEDLPERLGEPDCPYFLKTQRCKFGSRCKFNHPKDRSDSVGAEKSDALTLPERPSEPLCAFYVKTGNCKFSVNCKFHHPKDIQTLSGEENGNSEQTLMAKTEERIGDFKLVKPPVSFSPALIHNSKGLPIRPGEVDCPFYLKTGSCKYGTTCRYNHPDRNAINPSTPAMVHPAMVSAANMNTGIVNPSNAIYQAVDPRLIQPLLGSSSSIYPQRPGQIECDFYMKTGDCKFGERCKFHHPIDRSAPKQGAQQTVKLTLAGLPRREGSA
ncbi:zinc finger CCCH domain-containing protein 37 isoform X3 [Benincasa hispida]|uniref:zinc finger CCCH domain-containing protein 37 isoform X3 n=1 Tax=Benincasa hispida TaxID=102211 RepID=UPI001900A1AD|nr:zinc finger CCCH domain-containing protein 37 isoform X3 [Benincasa hispida]